MNNFTEKQIETFMSAINNGILDHIYENDSTEKLEYISKNLSKIEEGRYIFWDISANQVANEFNARGETYDLIRTLIDNEEQKEKRLIVKLLFEKYKQYIPKPEVNRKTLINLLGLRDFATKEDILKELNEIL